SLSVGILCLLLSPRAGAAVAECAPGTPGGLNPYDARPRASASAPRLPDPILLRQVRQAADRRRRLSLDRDPWRARSCVPKRSPENDRLPLLERSSGQAPTGLAQTPVPWTGNRSTRRISCAVSEPRRVRGVTQDRILRGPQNLGAGSGTRWYLVRSH